MKLQLSLLLFACAGSAQQSNFFPGFGFEVNEGQFPAHVTAVWQSTLTGPVYTTAEGVIRSARTQVRWRGMNAYQRVVGIPQPGVHRNLYQSNDAAQWRTNQPFWDGIKIGTLSENPTAEVTLRGTLSDPSLPGVRLGRLSLEMRLRPGESLENFSLEVLGWTSSPGLGPGWVQFVGGESPGVASFTIEAFQTIGGERRALTANFNLQSNFVLGVTVSGGEANADTEVTIGLPFGGISGSQFLPPKAADGNRYALGSINRASRFLPSAGNNPAPCDEDCADFYVAKVNDAGELIWISFIGGSQEDRANRALALGSGLAVPVETKSKDFPLSARALDRSLKAGRGIALLLLDPSSGRLVESTYAGAAHEEWLTYSIADGGDLIYATSALAPLPSAVTRWRAADNRLVFRTEFPRPAVALAATRQNRTLLALQGATFAETARVEIAVISAEGQLDARRLEIVPPSDIERPGATDFQLWPAEDGSAVVSWNVYSRLNGSRRTELRALAFTDDLRNTIFQTKLSASGIIRSMARTARGNWKALVRSPHPLEPTTPDAALVAGCVDSDYFKILSPAGATLYASYADALRFDFASASEPAGAPARSVACISGTASRRPTTGIAPGELVTITGGGFGPEAAQFFAPDANSKYPISAAGFRVRIGGLDAPLIAVARGLLAVQTPFELGTAQGPHRLELFEGSEAPLELQIQPTPRSLKLFDTRVRNAALGWPEFAALNEDGTPNSAANPARPGTHVSLFGSGLGILDPPLPTGGLNPVPPEGPLSGTRLLNRGWGGAVTYIGSAPGLSTGVVQLNFLLPAAIEGSGVRPHGLGVVVAETARQLFISEPSGVIWVR